MTAAVRVEVLQGLAREITLALPAGLVVNQVNGATVADWEAGGGMLRVRLLEPAATEVSFVVQGEMRAPREGPVDVPLRAHAVGRARNRRRRGRRGGRGRDRRASGARPRARPIRPSSASSSPAASRRR